MAIRRVSTIRDEASVFEKFVIEKTNRKAALTFMDTCPPQFQGR
jgi:hypothetical protein